MEQFNLGFDEHVAQTVSSTMRVVHPVSPVPVILATPSTPSTSTTPVIPMTPVVTSIPSTDQLKLAWAAGFIDGDGCVSAVRNRYRGRLHDGIRIRLDVSQNDAFSLKQVQLALPAVLSYLNSVKRTMGMNRQPWMLTYDGRHAVTALEQLLPYLVRKKHEAEACIRLYYEGQLSLRPGPAGVPPAIRATREYWYDRLQRMK